MASLYSVIPGLSPTSDEIVEAELLAKQVLEGKFPDLDLREGTGLRDLVLRPTAYAFALLKKATDYYFTQNTLGGVDDSTPQETVDDIMSNWFLQRNTGTQAVISARLYFARQKNVTVSTDISFSPDNSLLFYPEEGKVYSADSLALDSYSNEWYLDVFLRAAGTGSEYNIGEGSLLYFTSFDPYFLRAEINYLAQESTPAETNSEFISRAATAISTRNLVNIPSVDSRLRQAFNYLDSIVTVGSGDTDMIRDMIQVAFDAPKQYVPTGTTISGNKVTYSVMTDTFMPGQQVDMTSGSPTIYNGRYTITEVGPGTLSVNVPGNPGFITQAPTVTLAMAPLYVHNAGMTDVYCGSRLSAEIVQVETNSRGVAEINGAVYDLERSLVSGGDEEDTVPTSLTGTSLVYTPNDTNKTLACIASGHTIKVGDVVASGIHQKVTITAIACTGLTVSVTAPGHGATVGTKVLVSGVTPSAYNGTYTVSAVSGSTVQFLVPAQITTSGSGSLMKLENASLADDAEILSVTSGDFVLKLPAMWPTSGAPVTGTLTVKADVPYTVYNPYVKAPLAVSLKVQNGIATGTLYNHGFSAGRRITITATGNVAGSSAVNGSWKITSVLSGSQFQFDVPALRNVALLETTADAYYIDHRYDFGFSDRQVLRVDFGLAYANKTASFELRKFSDVQGVQEFLDSPDNRVLCGDYLARGFNLHLLDVEVVSYNGPAASQLTIQNTLSNYVSSLAPGDTLVLSDMVQALGNAGISNIKTPIGVKYTRYTRDLTPKETGSITDYIDPSDKTNIFVIKSVTSTSESV